MDYTYDNFIKYLKLPENIKINKIPENYEDFNSYLGGIYSPFSFHKQFLLNDVTENEFIDIFFEQCSQIQPTGELIDLVKNIEIPDITIHLRRKDKIRAVEDNHSLNFNELDNLNNKTINFINSVIESNTKLYFASDDIFEKLKYEKIYKNNIIADFEFSNDVQKTYIDFYLLMQSKTIIMSQKHSNFSLCPSLIRKNNLIYFYNNSPIIEMNYSNFSFIKNYLEYSK